MKWRARDTLLAVYSLLVGVEWGAIIALYLGWWGPDRVP